MNSSLPDPIRAGFEAALREAWKFVGATAPNPPVGAAMLDQEGKLLGAAAHQKAGTEHAEARLIRELTESKLISLAHTLIVTLEPCNHQGRTPPCTGAILAHPGIREIHIGVSDPNPHVKGRGAERLETEGRIVQWLTPEEPLRSECERLIAPFKKLSVSGRPWVLVKSAHRFESTAEREHAAGDITGFLGSPEAFSRSMVPPAGQKTFTSAQSLKNAHLLRKQSDAILTGSGTILADDPSFTVRLVPDHSGKLRKLMVLDTRSRVPTEWLTRAAGRGFEVIHISQRSTWDEILGGLGTRGCLQVLIEAGPGITSDVLLSKHWDEHVAFLSTPGHEDVCIRRLRVPDPHHDLRASGVQGV